MGVQLLGVLFLTFAAFQIGSARQCYFCMDTMCTDGNKTTMDCNPYTVGQTNQIALRLMESVTTTSTKYECVNLKAVLEFPSKDTVTALYKGCIPDDLKLCDSKSKTTTDGLPILDFKCDVCKSDNCNGSSMLTQSAIVVTVLTFLLMWNSL